MRAPIVATALIAAVALAAPAEAAKKRKVAAYQKPAVVQNDPYVVLDYDGRVAGRDPDPNIRAAIRKSPRPWQGID
jgi:hypothetical protein